MELAWIASKVIILKMGHVNLAQQNVEPVMIVGTVEHANLGISGQHNSGHTPMIVLNAIKIVKHARYLQTFAQAANKESYWWISNA